MRPLFASLSYSVRLRLTPPFIIFSPLPSFSSFSITYSTPNPYSTGSTINRSSFDDGERPTVNRGGHSRTVSNYIPRV